MPYDPSLQPILNDPIGTDDESNPPPTLRELAERARLGKDGQALACGACGCEHRVRVAGQWRCRHCGMQV